LVQYTALSGDAPGDNVARKRSFVDGALPRAVPPVLAGDHRLILLEVLVTAVGLIVQARPDRGNLAILFGIFRSSAFLPEVYVPIPGINRAIRIEFVLDIGADNIAACAPVFCQAQVSLTAVTKLVIFN
jgi:hypothetical protein